MLRVSGLKARHAGAEVGLVQPFGHEAAKPSRALGRVEMIGTMKGVPRIGRIALAGDDENGACALGLRLSQELQEMNTRHLDARSVQIEAALDLHLSPGEFLGGAAVEARDVRGHLVCRRWRMDMRRGRRCERLPDLGCSSLWR